MRSPGSSPRSSATRARRRRWPPSSPSRTTPQTGTLRFTTEQEDAEDAVRIADAFADETVRYLSLRQEELHQARQTNVLEDVEQLEAEIRDLDQQIADSWPR